MKNLIRAIGLMIPLALFALVVAGAPPAAIAQQVGNVNCSQYVQYDASTNGSTRLFTANAASSNRVYICGYIINVGAVATNVQLKSGTGTACATGTSNITPNFVLNAYGQVNDPSNQWRGATSPAGNDLCIVTSAGNPVQAIIFYSYQQ